MVMMKGRGSVHPMMIIGLVVALVLAFALGFWISRQNSSKVSPVDIERDYRAQLDRVDFHVQNYTKYQNVEFPPKDADIVDRALFQIPEILDFQLMEEEARVGVHAEVWGRDPLVKSRFWFENSKAPATDAATVKTGSGRTRSGKEVRIAIYQLVLVEQATKKRLRCKLTFDLDALEAARKKAGAVR